VSKRFRLYKDKPSSLKETITSFRTARYEEFWALRDVSLEIPTGSTYGLIGHNGSGKSTLLRVCARIHRPTEGIVNTKGRIAALLDLGAGFHPELSGRENIFLNGAILGLKRKEVQKAFDEIVDFSGLHEFIDSPVKLYSTGMYVRLGFSIAVHVRPEVLIIDEVIAVGDADFQRRCFDHLNMLRRQGVTIVLVSHGLSLLQSMCDRVAWLDHGRLINEGKPRDVIAEYLHQVDDQEAERLAREHELDPESADIEHASGPGSRRQGTREIEVQSLEFLDADEKPVTMASTGDALTLRLHYVAKQPVQDPVFGLAVEHDSGVFLTAMNTQWSDLHMGRVSGPGFIDYHIPVLSVMPGKLLISVGVVDEHNLICYDFLRQWFSLHIRGIGDDRPGILDTFGEWGQPVHLNGDHRTGRGGGTSSSVLTEQTAP
jgi:ABC-2 type transport system ATP-binding protein/lipopolysaccharide transport system ATP-binding protein